MRGLRATQREGRPKGTGRRGFLKTVALAGGAAAEELPAQSQPIAKSTSAIDYPRTFSGRRLARIAFPLGGVGAGSISLGGRGRASRLGDLQPPGQGQDAALCVRFHLGARRRRKAGCFRS